MRTTAKGVHGSMLLCNLDSMVGTVPKVFDAHTPMTSLGCAAILARSFARIHETNLKVWRQVFYS